MAFKVSGLFLILSIAGTGTSTAVEVTESQCKILRDGFSNYMDVVAESNLALKSTTDSIVRKMEEELPQIGEHKAKQKFVDRYQLIYGVSQAIGRVDLPLTVTMKNTILDLCK